MVNVAMHEAKLESLQKQLPSAYVQRKKKVPSLCCISFSVAHLRNSLYNDYIAPPHA
jgi:hypothetical protein